MENEDKLKKAIADKDFYSIVSYIVEQQNTLLNKWFSETKQDFRNTLQQMLQSEHRVKQEVVPSKEELSYQIGVWEGWIQAFYALYDERNKEENILFLTENSNTMKILRSLSCLSCYVSPIRHKDLADALGMSYDELAVEMVPCIGYGAVIASRTGENTCYALTPTSKRFLSKLNKTKN